MRRLDSDSGMHTDASPGEQRHAAPDPAAPYLAAPEQLSLGARVLILLLQFLGAIPIGIRRRIGRALGQLFALLPTHEREIAKLQLRAFLPAVDQEKIVPKMFAALGETIFEGLNLNPIIANHPRTIRCCQPELFEWAISQGRPILGLTAHTGNWELFAAYLHARGARSVAIGRPARSKTLHQALAHLRDRAGIRVLWREGRGGMREIFDAFQQGYIVGALIDQDTRVRSIPVPFFGSPAQTPLTLIEVAQRYKALFFSAFIIREPHGTYSLHIKKLDENSSAEEILTSYHQALEEVVRANPEQWVWFHKRWRTLPSGQRRSGTEYLDFLRSKFKEPVKDS
ncbi:MAG: hypothetical protein EBZ48_01015 [Proteobacteria bacterium]|nr:hypothetical protein [Pseudomonadota bacterium]